MPTPTFNDAAGRAWEPRLDFVKLRTLRDKHRVDFADVERLGKTWAEVLADDCKALDTIWLTIEYQANETTKDDWLAAMDGDQLDAAITALGEAVVNFTRPLKRGMANDSIEAVSKAYQEAITGAETNLRLVIDEGLDRARASGMLPPKLQESLDSLTTAGR